MSKLGLVLEGGGTYGVYIAGVLDFFVEQNLHADGVIGVSANAHHACSYISEQVGRAYCTNTAYLKDKRYMSVPSLLEIGGLLGVKLVYEGTPNTLDPYDLDAFNTSHIELYAVVNNLGTGRAEYLQCINMERDAVYVRASASLPLLSRIIEVDGRKLLDGDATDSAPIHKFQEMGCIKNIVVLTQHKEYRKGKNDLLPMIHHSYEKYSKLIGALETRYVAYSRTLGELALVEKEGSVFLVCPNSPVEISRLEKSEARLQRLYEQSYMDAKNSFEELRSLIANEN